MTKAKSIKDFIAWFVSILVLTGVAIYAIFPISYASGIGRVTVRSVTETSINVGFSPTTLV